MYSESGAHLEVDLMELGHWIDVGGEKKEDEQGEKELRISLGFLPWTLVSCWWCAHGEKGAERLWSKLGRHQASINLTAYVLVVIET